MLSARRPLLMVSLGAALVLSCASFNFLIDPYGAWGTGIVGPAFGKINDDRLQIPYMLRTSAPETILVGSSRVAWGIPIDEGYRDGILNAGVRNASIPQMSRIIDLALRGKGLKRIIWFVDFFAFSSHHIVHDPHFDKRMEGSFVAKIEETLFSLNTFGDSFDTLKRKLIGRARLRHSRTVTIPWPMYYICSRLNTKASSDLSTVPDFVLAQQLTRGWYSAYELSPDLIRLFSRTVQKARARGVEVILVVPPMTQYELELIRQSGQWRTFEEFKRILATNGSFWDFAAYNSIAQTDTLFRDTTHMKPATGHMVLRIVLGEDTTTCDRATSVIAKSGVLVSPQTVGAELTRQNLLLQRAVDPASRYSRIASQVRQALTAKAAATPSTVAVGSASIR